jgi:peptide/nickel transport system substrate-binding protein
MTRQHTSRPKHRRFITVVISAAIVVTAGGSAIAAGPSLGHAVTATAPEGELVVALDRDPDRMDPNYATHDMARSINQALFDSLIAVGEGGELVPSLAESYEFPDDQTVSFALRQGVVFHNGEEFNATSVQYSVERLLNPELESHLIPQFESISEVEIVDDYHVLFHLSRPDAALLRNLTELMMVPPVYTEEVGQDGFEAAPVGTGPYVFESYEIDDRTTVTANPDYWEGSPKGMPLVGRVVFRAIPEATTRVAELTTGGVDIAIAIPQDQVATVEDSGATIVQYSDARVTFVQINTASLGGLAEAATGDALEGYEALQDPNVRIALNMAIDRDGIVESFFQGTAVPIGQMFGPGGFGYPANDRLYEYDPEAAMQMLADAGYPDGLNLDMIATDSRSESELALVMDNLSEIGVNVTLEIVDVATFNDTWTALEFPHLRYSDWGGPENVLDLLIRSGGIISAYANPDVDALIDEQAITLDPAARDAVMEQITTILHDDPAAIYLWGIQNLVAVGPDVSGWEPNASGYTPVTNVQVAG